MVNRSRANSFHVELFIVCENKREDILPHKFYKTSFIELQ